MADYTKAIVRARDFAIWAHGDQKYGDNLPYVFHLDLVAGTASMYGADEETIIAAYLHDVLEDTDVSAEAVAGLFGWSITSLVQAVTNEKGANRRERHAKTYPKTKAFGPRAIFLKLCDRISNSRMSIGTDKAQMYLKEYVGFVEALYSGTDELNRPLWLELGVITHKMQEEEAKKR